MQNRKIPSRSLLNSLGFLGNKNEEVCCTSVFCILRSVKNREFGIFTNGPEIRHA